MQNINGNVSKTQIIIFGVFVTDFDSGLSAFFIRVTFQRDERDPVYDRYARTTSTVIIWTLPWRWNREKSKEKPTPILVGTSRISVGPTDNDFVHLILFKVKILSVDCDHRVQFISTFTLYRTMADWLIFDLRLYYTDVKSIEIVGSRVEIFERFTFYYP